MTKSVRILGMRNVVVALSAAILWWCLIATFAMWHGIVAQWTLPFVSYGAKLSSIVLLYLQPGVYMSTSHTVTTVVLAVLAGVNIALIRHIQRYRRDIYRRQGATAGLVSTVLMFLGTGCAACGSMVLLSIGAMVGVGVGASVLPVIGELLMYLAIAILVHANYRLYRQATNPLVCRVL